MSDLLLDLLKLFLACVAVGLTLATAWQLGKKYFGKKTTLRD
uniref:Uncharacterized protein n=1 Tax=Pantoea phage Survivor TaxID=3232176 RepID=A0AAU8L159_9CAUD